MFLLLSLGAAVGFSANVDLRFAHLDVIALDYVAYFFNVLSMPQRSCNRSIRHVAGDMTIFNPWTLLADYQIFQTLFRRGVVRICAVRKPDR